MAEGRNTQVLKAAPSTRLEPDDLADDLPQAEGAPWFEGPEAPEGVEIPPDTLPNAKKAREKPKGKAKADATEATPRANLDEPPPLEVDVSSADEHPAKKGLRAEAKSLRTHAYSRAVQSLL